MSALATDHRPEQAIDRGAGRMATSSPKNPLLVIDRIDLKHTRMPAALEAFNTVPATAGYSDQVVVRLKEPSRGRHDCRRVSAYRLFVLGDALGFAHGVTGNPPTMVVSADEAVKSLLLRKLVRSCQELRPRLLEDWIAELVLHLRVFVHEHMNRVGHDVRPGLNEVFTSNRGHRLARQEMKEIV